jgi:hypothetical protein
MQQNKTKNTRNNDMFFQKSQKSFRGKEDEI